MRQPAHDWTHGSASVRPAVTRTYSSRPPRGRKIPQITEHLEDFRPVLLCGHAGRHAGFERLTSRDPGQRRILLSESALARLCAATTNRAAGRRLSMAVEITWSRARD